MKKIAILLAPGFEEMEAVIPADLLVRSGVQADFVSVCAEKTVKGSRGISLVSTLDIQKVDLSYDGVIVPGGMPGAVNLAKNAQVSDYLCRMFNAGKLVCSICASPAIVLAPLGILKGRHFTCYPDMEKEINPQNIPGSVFLTDKVVTDGNLITSRGPGTASDFGLAVIEALLGKETALSVGKGSLFL
jgi:4-methyl-5(b-hydroxyethyl)-thiazole monophosphate biosynthesis